MPGLDTPNGYFKPGFSDEQLNKDVEAIIGYFDHREVSDLISTLPSLFAFLIVSMGLEPDQIEESIQWFTSEVKETVAQFEKVPFSHEVHH
jgi:hypothetical protein